MMEVHKYGILKPHYRPANPGWERIYLGRCDICREARSIADFLARLREASQASLQFMGWRQPWR